MVSSNNSSVDGGSTAPAVGTIVPPEKDPQSPVVAEVLAHDTGSAIAAFGHPLHAMLVHFPIALVIATAGADLLYWWGADAFWLRVGVWAAGGAFASAVLASVVGTLELLAVPGIRVRVASWSHAVAALTLLAATAANWGVRWGDTAAAWPHPLLLSLLCVLLTGFAGWHGGKLVFDHGVGIVMSPEQ